MGKRKKGLAQSDELQKRIVVIDDATKGRVEAESYATGYKARPLQWELHQKLKRFNVLVTHRRFGKSVFGYNHMNDRCVRHPLPMPRFAYIANTYGQAERVIWDYAKYYTLNVPGAVPNEGKLRIDYEHNKGRIMLLSAENLSSLPGIYLDGVIFDEFGLMNPTVWTKVVRPMLSDRKGWAIFMGTFEGRNHFYKLWEYAKNSEDPEWFQAIYKASQTNIISKEELESARKSMSEEEYMEQYECEPTGLVGAYFTKELSQAEKEERIGVVPHDAKLPVDTYWDLGMNDTTAVWFVQSVRGDHRVIDYYEVCGQSLPDTVAQINRLGYMIDQYVLPHDASVRDLSTGKSRIEMMYSLGCRNSRIVPRVGKKMESINAARVILKACRFDRKKCEKGINALANYQRRWNDKNMCFEESPLHNWASNGSDAFQCFAMGVREDSHSGSFGSMMSHRGVLEAVTDYDPFDY